MAASLASRIMRTDTSKAPLLGADADKLLLTVPVAAADTDGIDENDADEKPGVWLLLGVAGRESETLTDTAPEADQLLEAPIDADKEGDRSVI